MQPLRLQLLRRYRWLWPGSKRKAYAFPKEITASMCMRKLIEAFPILETAGGYEILRTGERGNRQLMVISMPLGRYTVPYLKVTIVSAKGYIRPLHKDIMFTPSPEQEQIQVGVLFLSPAKSCSGTCKYSLCKTQGA